MDPALWELLSKGDRHDEVAAIIKLRRPGVAPAGVRLVAQFGEIATCRLERGQILKARSDEETVSMKGGILVQGEQYVPLDPAWEDRLDTLPGEDEHRPAGLKATGKGVVVAVIDWGFDFAHPDFCRPDGTTRLLALWDQRPKPGFTPNNRYGYGQVHWPDEINRALKSTNPYAALSYRPADFDPGGGCHGTHVPGIAAGNGRSGGPLGLAPDADLIFVHLSTFDPTQPENLGDSVTLLEAIDFIFQTAGKRPCVINMSLGRHGGPHDGSSPTEQGLDAALIQTPGRAIVQSTGNYFDRHTHAFVEVRQGLSQTLHWEIDEADVTPNELEVWYPSRDRLIVQVSSPDGAISQRVRRGEQADLVAGGRSVGRIYHRAFDPNNLDHQIKVILQPGGPPGSWKVTLTGEDVVDGRCHAWIERDAGCRRCQSIFEPAQTVGTTTTGTICNGFRTIAVGAYDQHSAQRELAFFSSSGPTRDGRPKPDLIAPGVAVLAARSAGDDPTVNTPLLTRKSGTSMAAPHVAGTIALMFEAARRPLTIQETRQVLFSTAEALEADEETRLRCGAGYLDTVKAVELAGLISRPALELNPWPSAVAKGETTMSVLVQKAASEGLAEFDETLTGPSLNGAAHGWGEGLELAVSQTAPALATEDLNLAVGTGRYRIAPNLSSPDFTATTFEEGLRWAFRQTRPCLIAGSLLNPAGFRLYRWNPDPALPATLPLVIEFRGATDFCALVLNGGSNCYFPADLTAPGSRWVAVPRLREFYNLPAADQTSQRSGWIRALGRAGVGYSRRQLEGMSVPALRLLLAHFADRVIAVGDVNQPASNYLGAQTHGLTRPVFRYPLNEPDCYLPVITEVEGRLESINAYDLGAGISLGPIQVNVQRAALFRFLGLLWEQDRALFDQELGRPAGWSIEAQPDRYDLIITNAAGERLSLHGRAAEADVTRNIGYFQSGQPDQAAFSQIDPTFRHNLTVRFRNLVAWPHVQQLIIDVSDWWLAPGLAIIEAGGIARLDPANPDHDTFVLKAMLLSSYVRFSGYLERFVRALGSWTTPAEKLAHWEEALNTALDPAQFPPRRRRAVASHRERLRGRLQSQQRHAEAVHAAILRQARPAAPAQEAAEAELETNDLPPSEAVAEDVEMLETAETAPMETAVEASEAALVECDQEEYEAVMAPPGRQWVELADEAVAMDESRGGSNLLLGYLIGRSGPSYYPYPVAAPAPASVVVTQPAIVYDGLTSNDWPEVRQELEQVYEVVHQPGDRLDHKLQPGDLVVRRGLGEGNLAHVFMLADGLTTPAESLSSSGVALESERPGLYARTIEAGPLAHTSQDAFARRLADSTGQLDSNQLVLRLRELMGPGALQLPPVLPVPPIPTAPGGGTGRWATVLGGTDLRPGNATTFLIDGPTAFRAMVEAIRTATGRGHYIYLLGWWLSDDFEMIPGDATTTIQQLFRVADGVGVQIRAMLWDQFGRQNSAEVDRINRLRHGAAILDNLTLNFGAHHQKVLIVKGSQGLITFCGGIDINADRINASASSTSSTSSSGGAGAPLHDVHCRIIGPASHDLLSVFIQRWQAHPDHTDLDRSKGRLLGMAETMPSPVGTVAPGAASGTSGSARCTVKITRTFNQVQNNWLGQPTIIHKDRSIRENLLAALRGAQRFIYMEDQYLVNMLVARTLAAVLPSIQHLTILIPHSRISDMPRVWEARKHFVDTIKSGPYGHKARVFYLLDPATGRFGAHTYVHAKTYVIDDELAIIGSANCNRRGLTHDSEVNAFIFDDPLQEPPSLTFAQCLRMNLWAEHLNTPAASLSDGVASASLWTSPPSGARVRPYNQNEDTDSAAQRAISFDIIDACVADPGFPC